MLKAIKGNARRKPPGPGLQLGRSSPGRGLAHRQIGLQVTWPDGQGLPHQAWMITS
jgi:hypothetical protein